MKNKELREKLEKLWEDQSWIIMKSVHRKNELENSQTQVDICENTLRLDIQLRPSFKEYNDDLTLFAFSIKHDPFISYEKLNEIFGSNLDKYLQKLEK